MKFVVACLKYFGKREGQTAADFAAECKALTPEDRVEVAPALSDLLKESVELQ